MTVRILRGDCREVLRQLPDCSVHMVCTSPPYWGLRDYGTGEWEGGDPACGHANGRSGATRRDVSPERLAERAAIYGSGTGRGSDVPPQQYIGMCAKCGARRIDRQIGLEPTPAEYVAAMVEVFREVWRVLRDDGCVFLNLGDAYCSGTAAPRKPTTTEGPAVPASWSNRSQPQRIASGDGLKPKDLLMMPARVALALQADGWTLRSDIIWAKRNCMPESVRDRPTTAHEHVFLLTKGPKYFYDATAIEEDGDIPAGTRAAKGSNVRSELKDVNSRPPEYYEYTGKRNKRSVWWIATQPYRESHFAVMPAALVEPCILAGTSERGCCRQCGAPWVRQTERESVRERAATRQMAKTPLNVVRAGWRAGGPTTATTGWLPSCSCAAGDPVPCTVLDPFGGAGTTALVCDRLQRDCILVELNGEYAAMAENRLLKDGGLFMEVAAE